jgi:hypothetical protein
VCVLHGMNGRHACARQSPGREAYSGRSSTSHICWLWLDDYQQINNAGKHAQRQVVRQLFLLIARPEAAAAVEF